MVLKCASVDACLVWWVADWQCINNLLVMGSLDGMGRFLSCFGGFMLVDLVCCTFGNFMVRSFVWFLMVREFDGSSLQQHCTTIVVYGLFGGRRVL